MQEGTLAQAQWQEKTQLVWEPRVAGEQGKVKESQSMQSHPCRTHEGHVKDFVFSIIGAIGSL